MLTSYFLEPLPRQLHRFHKPSDSFQKAQGVRANAGRCQERSGAEFRVFQGTPAPWRGLCRAW